MINNAHESTSSQEHRQLTLEKLAFLPAALEIQAAPPPKWSRSLLWAISALIVIIIVWASWAEIDIIATAQGKIVPSGRVKIIQPLETGVVKTIFVKEGQHVKAGDKLIALDNTASQADTDRLSNEWRGLTADLARLQQFIQQIENKKQNNNSEKNNQALTQSINQTITQTTEQRPVPKLATIELNQRLLLESSLQEYQSKIDSFLSEIIKLKAEKKAIKINVIRLTKTLPLITEQVQSLVSLLSKSLVSRNQYLELEQERINQEEMLNLEHAKVEQISASIRSAEQSLRAYRAEVRRNTLQEINQLNRQSESTKQELTKAKRLTTLRILTSPVDGVVEALAIATIGGIVTPAQALLKIVPNGQILEIEAGLLNKDIGFVHTGQSVEIKIDSFEFTKYGVIDGEVTDISADAIEHEQKGLLFPLKASIVTNEINVNGKWVKLKPGMSVTVEIKTGTRRLMEFLLAPLMRGVSEGARER